MQAVQIGRPFGEPHRPRRKGQACLNLWRWRLVMVAETLWRCPVSSHGFHCQPPAPVWVAQAVSVPQAKGGLGINGNRPQRQDKQRLLLTTRGSVRLEHRLEGV